MEPQNYNYSTPEELERLSTQYGLIIPPKPVVEDPETPTEDALEPAQTEMDGEAIAGMIARFTTTGARPNFKEALKYRDFMSKREVDMFSTVGQAMAQTASDLGEGAYELASDAVTLKIPKIAGSLVEGAIMGTANWYYMYKEGQFNEDSFIHKLLYKSSKSDEEYYSNLMSMLDLRQQIEERTQKGYFLPKEVEVAGVKFDLWNPAVVMAVSYVADPSWVAPNFGIESALIKGANRASSILALNAQLANVTHWSLNSIEGVAKGAGAKAGRVASGIVKVEEELLENLHTMFGIRAFVGDTGKIVAKEDLTRGAMTATGFNQVKIPAWDTTSLVWAGAKLLQAGAETVELGAKLAKEAPKFQGMRLSERMAMESTNPMVSAMSGTWAKTGSPFLEWSTNSAKTTLHAGMYGGAFGFTFGGEEGFYNGLGSGFVLGGAFHQIGAFHNTVSGGGGPSTVVKEFLWATQHYDLANQQGLHQLFTNIERDYADNKGGAEKAKLELMSDIASSERLARDTRRLILTEKEIKSRMTDAEWVEYEQFMLKNADKWGGVAFRQKMNGEKVTIINADRAVKSAVKEELFHTLMLDERYRDEFHQQAMEALIGTSDHKGALLRMPKEKAVALLEQFKEVYLGLENINGTITNEQGHSDKVRAHWDEVIQNFKQGTETTGKLHSLFEEFLASYWNRYIEDKPIDFLLKGGDLGVVRNAIQLAKDAYHNTMYSDLTQAGARFNFGRNIDHFFIDQNTGQRVRIPKLEKLMQHFVQRASKDMYQGWKVNSRKSKGIEIGVASQLEHLWTTNADGTAVRTSEKVLEAESAVALKGVVRALLEQPIADKGLKITVIGKNADGKDVERFSYSKPKKEKKPKPADGGKPKFNRLPNRDDLREHWRTPKREMGLDEDVGSAIPEAESVAGDDLSGAGQWSQDKRKKFWESVWEGNPRIRLTGKATTAELKILSDYLPANTVARFAQLNTIIEMAREGVFGKNVSNIAKTEYIAREREEDDGSRVFANNEIRHTNFIPVEINLYFGRTKKMVDGEFEIEVGNAEILVKSIDHDALLARIDYAWNNWNEAGVGWKTVRKLFETKASLYQAIKDMLTHYSNSEMAEAGIKMFMKNGAVGPRDAGHMRTIVNAVIGFHPTKEMVRTGEHSNPRHKLQQSGYALASKAGKIELPDVVFDMNIRRMGSIKVRAGEGFGVDWNSAYVRSQYNHSPAKSKRDHEGNPLSGSESSALANSVYRNKDGEVLSVYTLNKPLSTHTRIKESSVYDYVSEGLAERFGARGGEYYSPTGWLHYTPDMGQASMVSNGSMKTGYIDTQRHIDISDIHSNSPVEAVIGVLVDRIANLSGMDKKTILAELLTLETGEGVKIGELFNSKTDAFAQDGFDYDLWLFTPETVKFMKKYGVQSIEYQYHNPISEITSSAVGLLDNNRFIENVSRRAEANYFAFSPAKKPKNSAGQTNNPPKTISEVLEQKIRGLSDTTKINEAFLNWVVANDGVSIIENPRRITEEGLDLLVQEQLDKVGELTAKQNAEKFNPEQRLAIAKQLRAYTISALRKQFPHIVSNKVLGEIADIALLGVSKNGVVESALKGTVGGKDYHKNVLKIRDTVLARFRKGHLTKAKIEESGIPMLSHIAEMSERDYQIFKAIPQYLEAVKTGKTAEWLQSEENQSILNELFGKHGGVKKFYKKFDDVQKDIFFLLDQQLAKQVDNGDKGSMSIIDEKAMRVAFAEKTKAFLFETLRTSNMGAGERSQLLKTNNIYRDIKKEAEVTRALFRHHADNIKGMVTAEFHERVMDALIASDIQIDLSKGKLTSGHTYVEIADFVRANLYDQAKKGTLKLGSYEAIAESVRLFYSLINDGGILGKDVVIDTARVVKENLLKALKELEDGGFEGINWVHESGRNTTGFHLWVGKGDTLKKLDAFNIWHFEGTHFKVVEEGTSLNDSALTLRDIRTGEVIISQPLTKEQIGGFGKTVDAAVRRQTLIKNFLKEATHMVNKRQPALALSRNFGEVKGPTKSYILSKYLQTIGGQESQTYVIGSSTFDNFALYKQGEYFVAVRISENDAPMSHHTDEVEFKDSKVPASEMIASLERDLANGVVAKKVKTEKGKTVVQKKKATLDELVKLREKITALKGKQRTDRGVVLHLDGDGAVNVVSTASTIMDMSKAIADLKQGTLPRKAFESYIKEIYRDHHYKIQQYKQREKERIEGVLKGFKMVAGKRVNTDTLSKIKELQKELEETQSVVRELFEKKYRELRKQKDAFGKEVYSDEDYTPAQVYKEVGEQVSKDLKNRKQNVTNAQNKVYALEVALNKLGAFPELDKYSDALQQAWYERASFLGKDEDGNPYDTQNWLDTTLPMQQGETAQSYAQRLRGEYQKQLADLGVKEKHAQDLQTLLDADKDNVATIKDKLKFLVRQYAEASGKKVTNKWIDGLFSIQEGDESGNPYKKVINLKSLQGFVGAKAMAPRFLADTEGVAGKKQSFVTLTEMQTAFVEGILTIEDNWRGMTSGSLERINTLIARAEKLQSKPEPRPVRPEGMSNAEWQLTELYYTEKEASRRHGYTMELPSFTKWVKINEKKFPKLALEVLEEKNGQPVLKNRDASWRGPIQARPKDIKLLVQEALREANRERGLLYDDLLNAGMERVRSNAEFDLIEELNFIQKDHRFTKHEQSWITDPVNRKKFQELRDQHSLDKQEGSLSPLQVDEKFIKNIKEEIWLTEIGAEGRDLVQTQVKIENLYAEVQRLFAQVDALEFKAHEMQLKGEKASDIASVDAQRKHLETRIFDINREIKPLEARINQTLDVTNYKDKVEQFRQNNPALERLVTQMDEVQTMIDELNAEAQQIIPPTVPVPDLTATNAVERNKIIRNNNRGLSQSKREQVKKIRIQQGILKQKLDSLNARAEPIRKLLKDIGVVETPEGWTMPLHEVGKPDVEISPIQIAKYTNPHYQKVIDELIQRRFNMDAYLIQRERSLIEKKAHAEERAKGYNQFVQKYEERAKALGYSGAGLIVSPNNPRTHQLYLAFPKVSWELYGSMHPLDWSGSEWQIGFTNRGEQTLADSSSPVIKDIAKGEKDRRLATLADYMHSAQMKAEYHMANPDKPISAEDALLIKMLVPNDVYTIPQSKLETINQQHWSALQRLRSGILDNLDLPANRKALVTRFVEDALDLVLGRRQDQVNAYIRLEGITEAQFQDRIKGMSPEEIGKLVQKKEYIEQAFYWLQDAKDVNGFIYLTERTQSYEAVDPKNKDSTKPFKTEKMTIQSIAEMEGFLAQLQESMDRRNISSMFDQMPYAKVLYEKLPLNERVNLNASVVERLALENNAGMARAQGLINAENQGRTPWFPDQGTLDYTGHDKDTIRLEHERVEKLLLKTLAVEISIARYKSEVTNFIATRTFAKEHLLSLTDSGVHFGNLDWVDGDIATKADSLRYSNDGRYIIRREPHGKQKDGKSAFRYKLYFKGESFVGVDGAKLLEIPTSEIGCFTDITQARVMAHFIEDDVVKLRHAQSLITGGQNDFSPVKVLGTIIPYSKENKGFILGSLASVPAFAKDVIDVYEKSGGKPEHSSTLKRIAGQMQDFGELAYFVINKNGQPIEKKKVITPSMVSKLSEYFDLSYTIDGHMRWTSRDRPVAPAVDPNSPSVADPPPASAGDPPVLPQPTPNEQKLSDISNFEAIENVQVEGQNYQNWQIIRNKLGYQIIRTKENGNQIFKLFNSASAYIGQYHHEQDAVDEIFAKEFDKKGKSNAR